MLHLQFERRRKRAGSRELGVRYELGPAKLSNMLDDLERQVSDCQFKRCHRLTSKELIQWQLVDNDDGPVNQVPACLAAVSARRSFRLPGL